MVQNKTPQQRRIKVWDAPIRLFHWALVILVTFNFIAIKLGGPAKVLQKLGYKGFITDTDLHMLSGQTLLTLMVFRFGYGLIGSTTARFSNFLTSPLKVWMYLRSGGLGRWAGHNPAGGWMAALMLVVLGAMAGLGLFANDDIMADGPLMHLVGKTTSDSLTWYHRLLSRVLLGLVVLHVAAIIYYRRVKKDNLIPPMLHGYKDWPENEPVPSISFTHPLLALGLLGASAALVIGVVRTF
ncbi:MAG: hypothetical protein A2516_09475 [Alphaproteobacteria bacterium RIFOXYD12_FULL_60_8]|nr:MAG: hypothetical protein A2516_09475 [Alphaproteobacteria bacterium RIFOXYD12_FULL_60_8]